MTNPTSISWIKYGWETTFGTESTEIDKSFGDGLRITTLQRRNNVQPVFTAGYRNAQALIPTKFEGLIGIEFNMGNPWFLKAVTGGAAVTGSGPYTHTYAETDTIPSFSIENNITTDTKSVATLLGCKVQTCVITAAVGEIARVKLDIPFANETHGATTSAQVAESFDVFTFASATLEMPNASTIADVQTIELTINQNTEMLWGIGSRTASKAPVKNRAYSARLGMPYEAMSVVLQNLWGGATGPVANPAEVASLELTFDNGLTSTNQRQILFLYTGVAIDEHNMPQEPTAVIMEEAPLVMRSLSVTAINNSTETP